MVAGCASPAPGPAAAPTAPAPAAAPTATAAAPPQALAAHDRVFGPFASYRGPTHQGHRLASRYVSMSDGVKLAVDLVLPDPLRDGERVPALFMISRYHRSSAGAPLPPGVAFFARHGYAVLLVDERGTGASFGAWAHPFSARSIADAGELVDWAVAQPWSNGRVGATGVSYLGTTAHLLASTGRPAVRAVSPKFMETDLYADVGHPGGLRLEWLLGAWGTMVRELDLGGPVRPVDGDEGVRELARAREEHRRALPFDMSDVSFRDERSRRHGVRWDDLSVHERREPVERSGAAIYGWGSWLDGATAEAVLRRFMTFKNPQRAVIGAWSHGGGVHVSPFRRRDSQTLPPQAAALEELRFFDHHLKGAPADGVDERALFYFTLGEERWKRSAEWPPPGFSPRRWHFAEGGRLAPAAPTAPSAGDAYAVDFAATTGTRTRWHTELSGGDVVYDDRASADRRLLTYTSDPLGRSVEITGHPTVTLWARSTHDDGAFHVYLETVAPDGTVAMVTEGQLRARDRTISPADRAPYATFAPYHSHRRADAAPLAPGELAELRFGLYPVSVCVPRGSRLRVAIAGADAGLFERTPAVGTPTITIERSRAGASAVDLPTRDSDGC